MITITQNQLMKRWKVKNSENPLVSIRCIAYNQEEYISKTLDGFLMQKTTFPFEIIIHDDASTDKTADIIREYQKIFPKVIKPIYEQENQYSKKDGSLFKIMDEACKGKYIASCEGDDYWTDKHKLQLQVSFLEKHNDYVMSHTTAKKQIQKEKKITFSLIGKKKCEYKDIFIKGNGIVTLTTVYRNETYKEYLNLIPIEIRSKWLMGDLPRWLYFAKNYKIKHFKRITGVYRVLENSASHSNDPIKKQKFQQSAFDIREYFDNIYKDNYMIQYKQLLEFEYAVSNKDYKKIIEYWKTFPKYLKGKRNKILYVKALINNRIFLKIINYLEKYNS